MLWCRVGEENASERGRGTLKRRSFRSFLFLPGGDGRKTNARPPFLSSLPAQQPRFFGVDMKIRCRACARGTRRAEETRNATGTREKRFSPSSAHPSKKNRPRRHPLQLTFFAARPETIPTPRPSSTPSWLCIASTRASPMRRGHRTSGSCTGCRNRRPSRGTTVRKRTMEAKRAKQRAPPAIVSSRRCKELPRAFLLLSPPSTRARRHLREARWREE